MGREAGEGDAEVDVEEPEPDTTGVELYDHVAQGHQPYLASCSSDKEMAASAGTAGRDGPGTEPPTASVGPANLDRCQTSATQGAAQQGSIAK